MRGVLVVYIYIVTIVFTRILYVDDNKTSLDCGGDGVIDGVRNREWIICSREEKSNADDEGRGVRSPQEICCLPTQQSMILMILLGDRVQLWLLEEHLAVEEAARS